MNQPENMTLKGTLEQRESLRNQQQSVSGLFAFFARSALILALILTPWAFASVHHWAQYWLTLSLLFGLGFWWFETAMNAGQRQPMPYVALFVIGGLLLGLIQCLPLPDAIANLVLGRQREIYENFSGDATHALFFSLNPEATWGQLQLLLIALAGLMLGCRYFRSTRDLTLLLTVGTANGVLLSFFGLIQKLTYEGKLFWAFEVEHGSPFASFVNKNNASGFLLMSLACCLGLLPIVMSQRKTDGPAPIISKEMPFWRQFNFYALHFIAELTATKLVVMLSAVVIATGVASCLSRGGVVALLFGGITTIVVYGLARRPKNVIFVVIPLLLMVVGLFSWVGFSDQLLERFETTEMADLGNLDSRVNHWRDMLPSISEMGLLGAGLGSYGQVHRLYTSRPELSLFQFAENQYFQSLVEAGWFGFGLFLSAWLVAACYALLLIYRGQSPTSVGMGTFGVFLLSSQAAASFFDFGLYTPANMFQFAVLVGCLGYHAQAMAGRLKKKNWLRYESPGWLVQTMLLSLFAGLTLTALDLHRRTKMDTIMELDSGKFSPDNMPLAETEKKIEALTTVVQRCQATEGLNYLAELWIHRARLQFRDSVEQQPDYRNATRLLNDDELANLEVNLWGMTSLQQIQENYNYLRRDVSPFQAARFINSSFLRENLPLAVKFLDYSRRFAPLQPVVHLRLGQLAAALGETLGSDADIENAVELAPANPEYRLYAALYYLQDGKEELALPHLRRNLELAPGNFSTVMGLLFGKTNQRLAPVKPELILECVMPDDSKMLYSFALLWLSDWPEVRQQALDRANELLGETLPNKEDLILLRADIHLLKGDTNLAIEAMQAALKGNPMDTTTQFRVAKLLEDQGELEPALIEAKKLLRFDRRNRDYNDLITRLEQNIAIQEDVRKEKLRAEGTKE